MEFPHDHVWKDGKRGKEHLDPSPEYKINLRPIVGGALVVGSVIGLVALAADDVLGIGALDDVALVPLSDWLKRGLIMIFG